MAKVTVRFTDEEKKKLDELSIKTGQSINKTIVNSIMKSDDVGDLKRAVEALTKSVNEIAQTSDRQSKALNGIVALLKQSGVLNRGGE